MSPNIRIKTLPPLLLLLIFLGFYKGAATTLILVQHPSMACTIDFRRLDEGFGGKTYKRKRAEQQQELDASMDVDNDTNNTEELQSSKRQAVSSTENPDKPIFGKPTYDGVIAGKVSGRKWKQPKTQRSSAVRVSLKKSTFEERAKQKEIKKAYKEKMTELKEEIRNNKIEKRKKKEEREKKKQENILKSGSKLQKITNPKTLKKIAQSKKKKLLKVVPDSLIKK
ncbi:putative Coiled-coil domain-containing protein [Helianthus anomalus]